MYKVISFGHRCSTANLIKQLNLKEESYPFDWLVSKLNIIEDCIKTNFVHFLDKNNYTLQYKETCTMVDNIKYHFCYEYAYVNTYYENYNNNIYSQQYKKFISNNNISTTHCKLACIHYDIFNNFEYYNRCVYRLNELLNSDIKKYYIYFHEIVGIKEFQDTEKNILYEFENFNEFIIKKTKNIFGLYFILITHNENIKSYKLIETNNYDVFIIFCNENFIDIGAPFIGEYNLELKEILKILKRYFV